MLYSVQSFTSHHLLFFSVFHGLELCGVGPAAEIVHTSVVLDVALFVTARHLTLITKEIHHMLDTLVDKADTSISTSLLTCHLP